MAAVTHTSPGRCRLGYFCWASLFVISCFAAPLRSEEPAADQSLFITVGNPITSTEFARVQRLTEEARRRYQEAAKTDAKQRRLKIVYDFNPDNLPAASPLFGPCQDLAAYLRALPPEVVSIAFVHRDVSRHTVLPVLACKEIVMAPGDGVHLGNVSSDDEPLPRDLEQFYNHFQVRYYRELAEKQGRTPAVVLKMLNKDLPVLQGIRADGSTCYVNPKWYKEQGATAEPKEVVLPVGSPGFYTAKQAQRFGLCKIALDNRRDVKDWFEMPDSSLHEDPLEGRTPKAFRIVVGGQFTQQTVEAIEHRLRRSVGQGANFLILQLECGGGDPVLARRLADFILDLKDNSGQHSVMTVAYVTPQASDYALFPALACNDIVMEKTNDKAAKLGDFERILSGQGQDRKGAPAPPNPILLGDSLDNLATRRDYPPLLVRAMIQRDLVVYHVRSKTNPSERHFVDEKHLQPDQFEVMGGGPVKPANKLLVLDPAQAKQYGLSRHTVSGLSQVYPLYGLEEPQVRTVGPDWFEEFAGFLRQRTMEVILVMLGITCLILELKIPGVGLPGIIAALCFILFFWAHAQLAFTWLAVLLFLMGLVLIALEIFVFPGTAVLGVSGVLLVLGGLALATMERWPQTEGEWMGTAGIMGRFGLALVGALLAAIVAARYLPSIPYASRLVLVPPTEQAATGAEEHATETSPYAGLLGAIGVAATTLRPSGMVRFGEEYVDVVAEGSYVEPGTRVQVIEIEGNRVVVKEV
jgi:membrane-bound ClpP family serine protease